MKEIFHKNKSHILFRFLKFQQVTIMSGIMHVHTDLNRSEINTRFLFLLFYLFLFFWGRSFCHIMYIFVFKDLSGINNNIYINRRSFGYIWVAIAGVTARLQEERDRQAASPAAHRHRPREPRALSQGLRRRQTEQVQQPLSYRVFSIHYIHTYIHTYIDTRTYIH